MANFHTAFQTGLSMAAAAGDEAIFLSFRQPGAPVLAPESFASLTPTEARAIAADLIREAHVVEARLRGRAAAAAEQVPA